MLTQAFALKLNFSERYAGIGVVQNAIVVYDAPTSNSVDATCIAMMHFLLNLAMQLLALKLGVNKA